MLLSLAKTIAFDLTCFVTIQANNRSSSCVLDGTTSVTICRSDVLIMPASRDCARKPPATDLNLIDASLRSGMSPVNNSRKLGFCAMISIASWLASGAMTTSVNRLATAPAVAASNVRFIATMPPKALTGSAANAVFQAVVKSAAVATPHGLACLMMAMVGSSNSATSSNAASVSLMLL